MAFFNFLKRILTMNEIHKIILCSLGAYLIYKTTNNALNKGYTLSLSVGDKSLNLTPNNIFQANGLTLSPFS